MPSLPTRSQFSLSLLLFAAGILPLSGCTATAPEKATAVTPEPRVVGVDQLPADAGQLARIPVAAEPEPVMAQPTDIWERMRDGFGLSHDDHPRIRAHLSWYARNPNYLERVFTRADPFLFHILESIEARDMPAEIAMLPVVESAFDPFAYSHGRAAGLWQFIPGTGKRFGLKQNWWYDGRRDVLASTEAALDYLEYLNRFFDGDWMLALAAYNSGEGTVRKAVRKNRKAGKPTDFWSLDLPRETRAYVPKLIALNVLVSDPDAYGLTLRHLPNEPRIVAIETGGQLDMAVAAKLADMPLDRLYRLNPGFNRWATDPQGPHHLVLPLDKAETFTNALHQLPPEQRVRWVRHKIQSGETLSHVAKRYKTTVAVLKDTNELSGHSIRAGKYLLVPVATTELDDYSLSADARRAKLQSRKRGGVKMTHVVAAGDTFWDLARKYKVSVGTLAKWNGMAPGDTLRLGQKLVIWNKQASNSTVRPVHYTVRSGDSLARISQRFRVSVKQLVQWNGIARNDYLQPGQKLKLYVDVTRQSGSS